jgi:serine/threonine protein phosphatase 1
MLTKLREYFSDQFQFINSDHWENIYVVGDVHGCAREFLELIKTIELQDSELLVCVGDLIRKGPDSAGAVNIVRNRSNVRAVLGNGEFDYLRGDKKAPGLEDCHREFIETWPLIVGWAGSLVVHGGFDPNKSIEEHTASDIVNMRAPKQDNNYETPFWFDEYNEDLRVFFGHTATNQPIHLPNAVALDTGCVYGGELTAFDTKNERLISVSARETYEPRKDQKYADTTRENGNEKSVKENKGSSKEGHDKKSV